jgi:flagellar biosynthesis/type III secretory pathway chaperone
MAIERLIDTLEQLNTIHIQMLAVAESKRDAIMNNGVDQLIGILNQESKIMKQIEQMEEARVTASYEFLQSKGIKSTLNLTLTEISRLVFDPDDKRKLLAVQAELSQHLGKLKELNQLNQKLIEQSLAFIDYSLEMLAIRPEQEATYQHPGEKHNNQGWSGLFDSRA